MKGLKPFPLIGLAILLCAFTCSCASHAPQSGPGALVVNQFTLNPGAIGVPYEQVLLASGGQTPYTWTLTGGSLPPGLSLQTNGIISGTPTLASGVTYPNTYNFSVKVTDSQTPTAAFNTLGTSIIINPALSFPSATLPSVVVGNNYLATVAAAGGISPYTYNVVFGSLPDGLTLTSSGTTAGTISGTPTTAGTFNFTIQATDSVSETATAAFSIVITGRLQGSYVISLNGFFQGTPFYMVGSFVADGNGNITSGIFDQAGPGGLVPDTSFTGTYSIPSGTNLGTMTLNQGPFGTRTYDMIVSTAGSTQLIMKDVGVYGSGLITKQTATSLPTAGVSYAFGEFGNDASGNRYAAAGAIAVNGSLAVTGGEEDTNDGGTVNNGGGSASPIQITGGNLALTLDTSTGRGTANLITGAGTTNYSYYVVSATQLIAVEMDSAGPATLMTILQQGAGGTTGGGSLSNSSLLGQAVMQLNAVNTSGGTPVPDVSAGVATFDGAGNIARTDGLPGFFTDENNGGSILQNSFGTAASPATYNVDATCPGFTSTCGRVTVTGLGPPPNPPQPVWYLVNTNQGFVVGTDPSVTAGSFQMQNVPQSGFTIASLLGAYLGSTSDPVLASVTNEVDVATTPPPGGIFSVNYETSGPGGPQAEQNFFGPYNCGNTSGSKQCSAQDAAFGRFVVTTSDPSAPQVMILYVLGSSASGTTGAKGGLVGLNVGMTTGAAEPNPRITNYGH